MGLYDPLGAEELPACEADADCSGAACLQGFCRPRSCGSHLCAATAVCVGDQCVDRGCLGVSCGSDETCAGGECRKNDCAATGCASTEVCVDDRCVPANCVGVSCPEGQACAYGRCLPVASPGGSACDPGQVYIEGQGCAEAACVGDPCLGADTRRYCTEGDCRPCAPRETSCVDGLDEDCDGTADCADSDCDAQACDDHDGCTVQDQCSGLSCKGSARACNQPPGPCYQSSGRCAPATGSCEYDPFAEAAQVACEDDGNPCTSDLCNGVGGCGHVNVAIGTPCDSGADKGACVLDQQNVARCQANQWHHEEFSACARTDHACVGTRTRAVTCLRADGVSLTDADCSASRPPTSEDCVLGPEISGVECQADGRSGICLQEAGGDMRCRPDEWFAPPWSWSACTVAAQTCAGTQSRVVTCIHADGSSAGPVPSCLSSELPATSQACTGDANTVCRPAAGDCDVAEKCSGTSATCPADGLQPSSFVCRAASGVCDAAETCSGTSAACPADVLLTGATVCRAATGDCDVAETCSGTSPACPADAFQANTVVCRAASGVCDAAEKCTGSSAACPADAFQASTVVCRAASGVCDAAEKCSGSSAACPADAFQANTVVCRAAAGDCDVAEKCTGSATACPVDAIQPQNAACTDDGNPCSKDICNATGTCTHPAGNAGAACAADGLDCTIDQCSGSSTVCQHTSTAACSTCGANLQIDVNNCGACGNSCMVRGYVSPDCCSGVCVDLDGDRNSCGVCGNACGAGKICCLGGCVPTQTGCAQ